MYCVYVGGWWHVHMLCFLLVLQAYVISWLVARQGAECQGILCGAGASVFCHLFVVEQGL